ncbi:MAG: methyltransferase domain-containing protein [Acidobacteria bacterium]|nr:methyltransferase domain-containing protein [Acidobacteriota bacterium]
MLETAAGTGILTRSLHRAVPQAQIVATDENPMMLEVAAPRLGSDRVSFQPADGHTQALPFADASFDLVVCHQPRRKRDGVAERSGKVARRRPLFSRDSERRCHCRGRCS